MRNDQAGALFRAGRDAGSYANGARYLVELMNRRAARNEIFGESRRYR